MSKNSQSKNTINNLNGLIIAISVLILTTLVASFVFLELGRSYYADRSAPRQYFNDYSISGITPVEAEKYLSKILDSKLQEDIKIQFDDNVLNVSYQNIEASYDLQTNLDKVAFYVGKPTYSQLLTDIFFVKDHQVELNLDRLQLEKNLIGYLPAIAPPQEAAFVWNDLALEIQSESPGNLTNFDEIFVQINSGSTEINIPLNPALPKISEADLLPIKDSFEATINTPIVLTYQQKRIEIPYNQTPEVVDFKLNPQGKLEVSLDPIYLQEFIDENVKTEIGRQPEVLEVKYNNGKVEFSGSAKDGLVVDEEALIKNVNAYLAAKILKSEIEYDLALKVKEVPPTLKIDPVLQARGIKEIIGTGYTTYFGSPANRLHNIEVGNATYSGMIIKKGEEFSFNENLGPVDASAGYLPELVIKSEGTIPEFGGGLCQVSTTIYRGALLSGLKISERYNHSYAVSYYAQVLGDGLDATIYPGVKDFKFVNDTPGDVLIQGFIDGPTLTYRFLGTSDGRKVDLEGPNILSRSGAGNPIYVVRPDLPAGTIKQTDKPHGGLVTEWIRNITFADGRKTSETIKSNYRSVPAKFLVSPDKNPNAQPAPPAIPESTLVPLNN